MRGLENEREGQNRKERREEESETGKEQNQRSCPCSVGRPVLLNLEDDSFLRSLAFLVFCLFVFIAAVMLSPWNCLRTQP